MNSPRRVWVLVALSLLVAAPIAHTRAISAGCAISPTLHLPVCDRNGQALALDTGRSQAPLESDDPRPAVMRQGMAIAAPAFSDVLAGSATHFAPPGLRSRAGKRRSIPAPAARLQLSSRLHSDLAKYSADYTAIDYQPPSGKRGADAHVVTPVVGLMQPRDAGEAAPRRAAAGPEPEGVVFSGLGLLILATRRLLPWLMRGSSRWRARNVFVASAQRSFPSVYANVAGRQVVGNPASSRDAQRIFAPDRALGRDARARRYVGGLR